MVLLSSLSLDYELILSIVENAKDMSLIEMKEKLLKEFDEVVKEGHHNGEGISSQ